MIPAWFLRITIFLVIQEPESLFVDELLVAAMIQKESLGQTCATRYEENWNHDWLVRPVFHASNNKITSQTEIMHQKTSWGLMQVMGAVARELGFEGNLVELCNPEVGIKYGIKKLLELQKDYSKMEDVVAAYNAGSPRMSTVRKGEYVNQKYVDDVMRYYGELK